MKVMIPITVWTNGETYLTTKAASQLAIKHRKGQNKTRWKWLIHFKKNKQMDHNFKLKRYEQ